MDLADARVRGVTLRFDLDAVVGDVDDESVEVRGQEIASDGVGGLGVEGTGVDQELQEARHTVRRVLKPVDRELESLLDFRSLHRGLLDPRADLGHREGPGRGQLDEPFFLGFKLVELLLELRLRVAVLREDVRHGGVYSRLHAREHVLGEALFRHLRDDSCLDLLDPHVHHGAQLPLVRGADEVLVCPATPSVLGVQEATGAASIAALTAEQHSLQIVEVDDVSCAVSLSGVEHRLHLQEGLLRYQRLVASDVELALVAVDARVVRIAQDGCEAARADRLCRVARRRSCLQPLSLKEPLQSRYRVAPSGVLFERPRDERGTLRIDIDRIDEATAVVLPDVQIAKLGAADRPALFDLVRHLDLDVLAVHTDLDFVHDVGDGFHGVGHVALSELLLGGDQADALLQELSLRDGGVGEVSEHAAAHVDDDVLNFRVLIDVAQELLELRTLRDGLGRLARLDELFRDGHAQLANLAHSLDPLGGDTVSVLVEVGCGMQLAWCRHTQIDDCLRDLDWRILGRARGRGRA
ncbi:MAG: hypothetical protein R2732_06770 [Microbacteriaceae bacterium]